MITETDGWHHESIEDGIKALEELADTHNFSLEKQQEARLEILKHNFPGLEHFPNKLLWTDEWYEFGRERTGGLNYLIAIDENSFYPEVTWKNRDEDKNGNMMDRVGKGIGDFHPISWYHEYDGGRAFYIALGHIPKVYENQWFPDHLCGGVFYAATGKGIEK
ncbi:ThuA domain-containing protein [Autumnicola musiva]|uniref:ThuA domain-containing protein n=1 Tax=Autumnicola musiva TaxID=3075589 RepID=A0ABU3D7M5_9FLAO|nr:ThuA domain-containing protein [Zunongwangia sp. F117]MDT0677533.1 ThuA domain-containing protein [Zunongwangia sp. F117]